jgi:hypothetical protein
VAGGGPRAALSFGAPSADQAFTRAIATGRPVRYPWIMKIGVTAFLLVLSNVFMTFAWYGHLKHLSTRPWIVAALVSWGIALFEYLIQVPANRVGFTVMNLGQLKILQEVVTLAVFVPFSIWYMREPLRLDFLWAGLCLLGAVYFVFRGH